METMKKVFTLPQLPSIHLIAGNDSLRPALNYIKFEFSTDRTKLNVVSTDAFRLVHFNLFDFCSVESTLFMKENFSENFYIHSDYFKPLTEKNKLPFLIELTENELKVWNNGKYVSVPFMFEGEFNAKLIGKYPNWSVVLPTVFSDISEISVNPSFFADIYKVFKGTKVPKIDLKFSGINKAISFNALFNEVECSGLIMPMMK